MDFEDAGKVDYNIGAQRTSLAAVCESRKAVNCRLG
jgi:hypothetical protein